MNIPNNQEIIETYLKHYRHSKQSVNTRKSCLHFFFNPEYFNFTGHVFEISTDILINYFDYLKHLENLSLRTKKIKWIILISFLNFTMEYYRKYDFMVIIPKHSINWNGITHKEPNTNKDVVMTLEEVKEILNYLKLRNFKYYLMFRTLSDTGMRKGGLININYDKINLEKRYIETIEKYGKSVCYYISKELTKLLEIYLKERELKEVKTKALFLSSYSKRFSGRALDLYLEKILKSLKIEKNITSHTFRRSVNTFRKMMGCSGEDRKILLNHKVQDVNLDSYVKLNYNQFIELYDKWYPYQNLQI